MTDVNLDEALAMVVEFRAAPGRRDELRAEAAALLAARQIFTPACVALIGQAEAAGGLTDAEADRFVAEALETFRWQPRANVTLQMYHRLHDAHRLIADVVAFRAPHINHLTPRTLDIDVVQARMPGVGSITIPPLGSTRSKLGEPPPTCCGP